MSNYAAHIVSNALAESKEKHTPSVRLLITTDKNLDTGAEEKRQFYADLWIGDRTVERTMKTLRELGYQGMSFYELNMPETLAGVECEIVTELDEWKGQQVERVKYVNPKGAFENRGLKTCPDDIAQQIARRYDSVLRGGKPVKSQPNPGRGPAYGTDAEPVDDLPF